MNDDMKVFIIETESIEDSILESTRTGLQSLAVLKIKKVFCVKLKTLLIFVARPAGFEPATYGFEGRI